MLCIKCKKRQAVVYIQRQEGSETKSEGYCLTCAQELNIKPVNDMLKRFGISPEDLEGMEEKMNEYMEENGGMPGFPFGMMGPAGEENGEGEEDGDSDGEEEFTPGGSPTFPFGMNAQGGKEEKDPPKDKKGPKGKGPKYKFLDTYCENLTAKARGGKLDNIIGRDKEIYRTIQILCRRQKNNPCLIGEAGVGKTAIAEGIAQRIAKNEVPQRLQGKEIYLLDMTALVAGTQFRGQFEQRVKGLINEVKKAGNIILFIDEVHSITGAGESEGAMNAANILKPALSRGEIQVIGATTFAEYRKYIEKDQALERRFQPVKVEEPSIADTISVMMGIKSYYEKHHWVKMPDALVSVLVSLSERYITDRFLPDKAIDLLDESCACCSLRHPEITQYLNLKQKLEALQKEEAALLQVETDQPLDYEKLAHVRTELARVEGELPALEGKVEGIEVTMEDISHVIELWTGIPAVKVQESEFTKLLSMEPNLKAAIIGQDEAVEAVVKAIRRSRADLAARKRPASFIFVGPTGVGKTELVKRLAEELFDTVDPLIRLDMTEFMEKFAISRLIGSPPGYVGYEEAGQLTEKVRRRPYSVVLFDEIEKAHPDVMNLLLQILDEGKINDAQGRTVDFSNTVICMTSNAGSADRVGEAGFNKTAGQMSENKAMKALGEFLRPEFLGRVDEVVVFKPLSEESLEKIAALTLEEYREPLARKAAGLEYTPAALAAIVAKAKGGKFGARDIRRTIRKEVEDPLAARVVEGRLGSCVVIDAQEGEILLR